jgi:prepilin-type N-terminal cleavage/methylation domain-containing protein
MSIEFDTQHQKYKSGKAGFTLVELLISMALSVLILGIGVASFSGVLNSRSRESSRTDALTSAQAALNIMSREVGNSGYGLTNNGLGWYDVAGVWHTDCTDKQLHFRTNSNNRDGLTNSAGEDITFYYDSDTQSVVRYDALAGTSGVINRVSDVDFIYYNYVVATDGTVTISAGSPSADTARVNIKLKVVLPNVQGQPTNRIETVSSDVTLRSSPYMLSQY